MVEIDIIESPHVGKHKTVGVGEIRGFAMLSKELKNIIISKLKEMSE